ncbi:MAG: Beta-barrel assembly-enhancing protease [Candidatus Udaeobacter sp.]|nr:MAG: Beta-barrel assembly-enhancing protease [Candidatus Udaeobacter sp.]
MQRSKIVFRIVTLVLAAMLVTACSKEGRKARFLSEADNYFKAGNYDKAKLAYLNVLRLDPQNALAFERIGAMWQDDGALLRAGEFLKRASELDPKNVQNRIRLARCYVATGRFADGTKEALKVLEQAPDNGDAIIALTEAARTKEDIEAAEKQLQKFPKKNDVSFYLASANLSFSGGNLSAAGNALQQALAADPKSSAAHMAMGNLHLVQKDLKQAGDEFKKAADLVPVRSIERLKYAAFKSGTGGAEETRRVATDMTSQAPDYLPGWILLAELASNDKKYDEALSLLENVFSRDAENIDGRRLQGNVLLAKGDTKKAVDVLERLDQTYPDAALIKYQLARAYVQSNNMNQAMLALDQAVSINPNYDDAVLLLAQINLGTGHGDKVIEPMTRLLKRRPDLRNAALLLAGAYGSLDRFDDAAIVLQEAAKLAPNDPQPQIALGLTCRQAKRNDEARQAFEKAAQLAPDNLFPIDQLIELDLLDKHFDAARQRIRSQFQKTPNLPAGHYWEGKILAAEGKWDLAEAELQRTLQLDPNFSGAYDLLVQTYLATNRLPQAVNELQAMLAKNPNNTPSLMTLALVYEKMKDYPKARDAYEKLLATTPNFVPALNNLAYLYSEYLNNLDKAYDLAGKARALLGQDASVGDTFGWVLYKRGDYQQALPVLQESAQKAGDNPEIQFHLGMTAYMMGQTDLAKAALKKAASATKDFPGKDETKRRLALLESGATASPQLSVSQLEAMAKEQPNDVIVQMRLGEAYEKQGAVDKAAGAFEQALKLNPKLVAAPTRLAQLNAGPLQNKEKALAYAKKARELAPTDPQVAGILGKVAYDSGNFTWSYSVLQEAVRQRANDPSILHDLAWAAYSLGKVNEARDAMQKVLTDNLNSSQAADAKKFLALAALDENPKGLIAAESELQKELKSNPEYVPALMAQAALDAQHGQTKPATEIYSDILRRLPDFAPAQKRLAAIYADNPDDLIKAYDLAMKARKTLSDDPELARTLAELNFKRKEFTYAIQLFQQSAANQPLPPKDLYYLGMAQLQTKQDAKGRETLEHALAAGLQDPLAQEARQRLAESRPE